MENAVHFIRVGSRAQSACIPPFLGKCHRICAPALEARSVTGGERRRLIEKKQFGVRASPDLTLAAFEFEQAANPLPRRPAAAGQRSRIGVETATAVAREQAARRYRGKLAERRYTILQRASAVGSRRPHRLIGANGAGDISLFSCLIR
jgi:hypothetical protein